MGFGERDRTNWKTHREADTGVIADDQLRASATDVDADFAAVRPQLRGDGGIQLQDLLDVMDRLKAAGVDKVGIINKLPDEK